MALAQSELALRRADSVQARKLAEVAARLDPSCERAWLILAGLSDPADSIVFLQKALDLSPHNPAALKGMAWARERLAERLAQPSQPPLGEVTPGHAVTAARALENRPRLAEFAARRSAVSPDAITQPVAVRRAAQRLNAKAAGSSSPSTLARVARYALVRLLVLFLTICASLFIIIYVANLGGFLDTIQKSFITESINGRLMSGWLRGEPQEVRAQKIAELQFSMEEAAGLHSPYMLRTAQWFYRGLTFDWGNARRPYYITTTFVDGVRTQEISTRDLRTIILTYLPRTLLLLGVSNLGLFLISILVALRLARGSGGSGGWVDRLIVTLAPTSSAPAWFYGLILYAIAYKVFGLYNLGLGVKEWPTTLDFQTILPLLRGLLLPFLAILISKFFQSIYSWRTYFQLFDKENYMELAKAKGLPDAVLNRRYLLRPALPGIITSFALIVISVWQESIVVEYFFNISGIGNLLVQGLNGNDVIVIVALVGLFAYILAITVFVLDIVYALIDPRVKVGEERQSQKPVRSHAASRPALVPSRRFAIKTLKPAVRPAATARKAPALGQGAAPRVLPFARAWSSVRSGYQALLPYPAALVGLGLILFLTVLSLVTVISVPYERAISVWRGDDKVWFRNPILAPPEWTNLFRSDKLPTNLDLNSTTSAVSRTYQEAADGTRQVSFTLPFNYAYDVYPQDMLVLFSPRFTEKKPFVFLSLLRPDGKEIRIKQSDAGKDTSVLVSKEPDLALRLKGKPPIEGLFSPAASEPGQVLQGEYQLKVTAVLFEPDSDIDVELVVYGHVYGLAGTDLKRRDLSMVLLWGTAVALAFGLLAAGGTILSSAVLAAAGAWFGGWVDGLIQRISEINMVLPLLPTSILIFYLYSKSIFVILGVTILLSIFGNSIKTYRAIFLQVVELPYIEAARSYGAPGMRIIFTYLIPRIRTVMLPQLAILVPGYIFYEATLAFLGVSDPQLPTLGKMLFETMKSGLFVQPIYLLLEPVAALLFIGLGFAMFGVSLERLFSERMG